MPSEFIQQQINTLLAQAAEALSERDWSAVRELADAVLAVDPDNEDASSLMAMTERAAPATTEVIPSASSDEAEPKSEPRLETQPSSFANGRYEVTGFLGEGGKKKVYLCRDTTLDRDVAFSLIKADGLDDQARQRVTREAQAMARLGDHPNLMPIHDMGQENDLPYLVQPYMSGGSVADLIEGSDSESLSLERSLEIAQQILSGLQFAHEKGIIHRDLKPGNVWLSDDGSARIGDFGLALTLDRSRLTQEAMMIGTVSYMPPEQATGGDVTPQADLYSLGAMLYEMVTGRPPFLGDNEIAIISQHINTPPVAPAWHKPGVPAQLDSLIMRLLAKDPAERPESAADVLTAISEIDLSVTAAREDDEGGSLDSMAAGVFVGRQPEMDRLKSELEKALSGHGGMVTLVGEPGIGKTRTALELQTYAGLRNAQVLWGRCYEESGAPPYWPWVQAIRSYVRNREPDALRSDMGSTASVIAEIVSDVKERLPEVDEPLKIDDPDSARFRLFDSIATFLKTAAEVKPLVLILDDIHWADKPSLMLLEFVARELASSRIFIVATYRDGELTRRHPLSATLGELGRERLFERVVLKGIRRGDVARFIEIAAGVSPPDELVDSIFTQTEGNPLFVTETVRLFVQEGDLTPEKLASTDSWTVRIPQGVKDAIGRRLDRLSDRAIEVLTTAAVIGRRFTLSQLKAVEPEISEDRFLDVLDEALGARIVEELADDVGRYQITHALTQQALSGELSVARKVRLHARIAEALEGLYGDDADSNAAELAYHYAQAESVLGGERLIHYSLIAGERALATYAHERALDYFQQALDQSPGREVRTRILERRAKLRLSLFEGHEALADFQQLLAGSKEFGDRSEELESLLGMGAAYYTISLDDAMGGPKSKEFYEKAYELASELGDKAGMVRALLPTGWFTDWWPDYRDQASANADEAMALSIELDDEFLIVESKKVQLRFVGTFSALEGNEQILEQLKLGKDLHRVKEQYFPLMWLTYRYGQFERCVEICDAGIELAAQLGMLPVQYPTIKALALMDLGRYGQAYDSAQQEVSDDAHQFGRANKDMATGMYLSEIMAFDRAEELLRDSIKQSIALSRAWMVRLETDSLVRLLIAAGRLNEEALNDVERSLQTTGTSLSDDMRSEIALSEGRPAEALQFADNAVLNSSDPFGRETTQDAEHRDRYFVVAAELKIRVLLALDRPEEALATADEALQTAKAMDFRAMLWRIHAAMSKAQIMLGNEKASEREEAAAAGVLRQLAESITDLELRQGFVSSPLVAPILTEPAERLPRLTSGDS